MLNVAAIACSMHPVDAAKEAKEMQRFTPVALNVEAGLITSINISQASGDYIWSDPMCPEGIKAKATYTVKYTNPADPLTKGCTGVVEVSKTEPTGLSEIAVKRVYTTEVLQTGTCQE